MIRLPPRSTLFPYTTLVRSTVKVLLVSPAAKVTVPLWPFADQLTVSGLATLSPLASERFTVKVRAAPSAAERSEERREGQGGGSRWWPAQYEEEGARSASSGGV